MIVRVIPRLDIKGPNLVKGVMLEGLRAAPPLEHARTNGPRDQERHGASS